MIQDVNNMKSQNNEMITPKAIGNSKLGKDEFLKLLTFQLKAQNPLKPYDNQEFAAQLAQFSQLEQLTDIRTLLEEQKNSNNLFAQSLTNSAIPGLLGKTGIIAGNTLNLETSDKANIGFNVPINYDKGLIRIYDNNGFLVRTMEVDKQHLTKGKQIVEWDGNDDNGNKVASGKYSFDVVLTDSKGTSTNAECFTMGKITAVRFNIDGTYLIINDTEIPFNRIAEIINE